MGAGKSRVGRLLADRLGLGFADLDEEIARRADLSIPEIWEREGEAGFRLREHDALREILSLGEPTVVAAGGGAILLDENVSLMRDKGLVVWLEASLEALAARVGEGVGRPLLEGEPAARLAELAASRRDRYAAAAHRRVDTTGREPEEVAGEIAGMWEEAR